MRFDDTLDTVLSADLTTAFGRQSAYRQLVDLMGRGRVPAETRVVAALEAIAPSVPLSHRTAAARGLAFAKPPAALVRIFARDEIAVAAPVLRTASLAIDEWKALLPELSPGARAVLRHRRDLAGEVERALESFGPVDFVLADARQAATDADVSGRAFDEAPNEPEPVALQRPEPAADAIQAIPAPFTSFGKAVFALPVVAEAVRRHEGDARPLPAVEGEGPFRIADVVARIDAFTERRERARAPANDPAAAPAARARFETDADGIVVEADGPVRAALIGLSLRLAGGSGAARIDGAAAGAFRQRARFRNANLEIVGNGPAAGAWLVSAVPVFDPASGRFAGYRGTVRRPQPGERAAPPPDPAPDALRQLVHELRTPTNAIIGFSEMIALEVLGPVEPPYRARAEAIQRHARDLLGAIDDLDLAARIDSDALTLRAEPVSLRAVLGSVVHDLGPLAELRGAIVTLPPVDATIDGDRHAVERLLGRLVATLLSATARGESLTMTLDAEGPSVRLSITRPAGLPDRSQAGCDVSDDDAAFAALPLGTGFALRLAENLARELGGEIVFASDDVVLRLPSAMADRTSAATKS